MEQHPVPQNVTTFQFRLVGDMTIKQFGYLAGGAILAYISFKLPLPFFFTWPLAALFALGGFGFAFIPIEERPMDVWFLSFIKSIYSPTQFLWQKTAPVKQYDAATSASPAAVLSHNPLNTLIGKLLDRFLPVPGPKKQAANTTHPAQTAAKATPPAQQPFPATPVVQRAPQPVQQTGFALKPVMPQQTGFTQQTQQQVIPHAPVARVSKQPSISFISRLTKAFAFMKPSTVPRAAQPAYTQHVSVPSHTYTMPTAPVQPKAATTILAKGPAGALDWLFDLFRPKQSPVGVPATATAYTFPNSFNAATPVTGKHLDIHEPAAPQAPQGPSAEDEQKQKEAQAKAHEMEDQVKKLTDELQTKQMSEGRILELQKQLMEALEHRNRMEQELNVLRQQLSQKKDQPAPSILRQAAVPTRQTEEQATVKVITPDMAVKAGLPRLTTFPNVITGIIKDNQGNLLPGILVTVKDKEDIPVRALKTNKLGQFAASTPLSNGVYTVDIEDPKGGHVFDRVRVTLNGSLLSPVEVISRTKKELDRAKLAAELFGPSS